MRFSVRTVPTQVSTNRKCGLCHQEGHNRASCSKNPVNIQLTTRELEIRKKKRVYCSSYSRTKNACPILLPKRARYPRQTNVNALSESCITFKEVQVVNKSNLLKPLAKEKEDELVTKATEQFADQYAGKVTCLVSDLYLYKKDCVRIANTELPIKAMQLLLQCKDWMPEKLTTYYDASALYPTIRGLILSPR